MKEKIISLIKKYRAASEKRWIPVHGYKTEFAHGQSNAYDRCADDLEKLFRHLTSRRSRAADSCPNCDGNFKHSRGCPQQGSGNEINPPPA